MAVFGRIFTACRFSSAAPINRPCWRPPPAAIRSSSSVPTRHPQSRHAKEAACGCAGCYTAHAAIELYAEAFDQHNALDKLEGFASHFGADFYGLPRNTDRITLIREDWVGPTELPLGEQTVIPLRAGEKLSLAAAGESSVSEDNFDDELDGNQPSGPRHPMAARFRGYLPVVVDVETGGFNCATDALLEIAATTVGIDESGMLYAEHTQFFRVEPFAGANIEQAALDFTGIKLDHPLRMAVSEEHALNEIFRSLRKSLKANGCKRAILVGHNSSFRPRLLNAAVARCGIKRNPFHPFSSFRYRDPRRSGLRADSTGTCLSGRRHRL